MIRRLPLVIAYAPRRVVCPDCGVRVERVPWADRWSRVTRSLSRAVAELARRADLSTVAEHYAINWKTVAGVIRRTVEWGLKQRRQRPLRVLGLDEVSRKKGHHYLTLAYDLEYGELAWVGKDRTSDTVAAFFDALGPRRSARIEAVCMDMWKPYRRVVAARAPQATICFDRFHVVRHLNAAVDEARRALVRNLAGPTVRSSPPGSGLLHAPEIPTNRVRCLPDFLPERLSIGVNRSQRLSTKCRSAVTLTPSKKPMNKGLFTLPVGLNRLLT
jgi:transposase